MSKIIQFKKGVPFQMVLSLPADTDLDSLIGYTGTCKIRKQGSQSDEDIIASPTFTWAVSHQGGNFGTGFYVIPDALDFSLVVDDTSAWPVGLADLDVRLEAINGPNDGKARYTQTLTFEIRSGVS